jgi:hypothetical protein
MPRPLVLALSVLFALLWGTGALAKPSPESKKLLEQGKALIEEGRFDDALALLREGYTTHQDPELLLYLGQVQLKLYRYREAKETLESYLRENPRSKSKSDVERILKKLPALLATSLRVSSDPAGATLWLDTQVEPPIGTTPFSGNIPPGPHTLIAQKEGYTLTRTTIEVKPNQENSATMTLAPSPATLDLSTDPPGAQIFLDEKLIGLTPFDGDIPSGEHALAVRKEGYGSIRRKISLKPSEVLTISEPLPPPPGFVRIDTSSPPPGAVLLVDGKDFGPVPQVAEVPPGPHKIKITAPGYREFSRSIQSKVGEEVAFSVELFPSGLSLLVESQPEGARLLVEGADFGPTPSPKALHFPKGTTVHLRVEKEGFKPYEKALSVEEDADYTLRVKLRDHAPRKTIAALTLSALAAGAGGTFGVLALQNDAQFAVAPSAELLATIRQQSIISTVGFSVSAASLLGAVLLLRSEGGIGKSPGRFISPKK